MKNIIALLMLGALPLDGIAQHRLPVTDVNGRLEEAVKLCNEGHYYAASRSITSYMEGEEYAALPALDMRHHDAEALKLVCDYYLHTPGTMERMEAWTENNKSSPYIDRLMLMQANLFCQNSRYGEALYIYSEAERDNVGDEENYEAALYEAICHIYLGEYDKADELLSLASLSDEHDDEVMFYRSYVAYVRGQYDEAITGFEVASQSKGFAYKAPVYLADCLLHTGKPAKALLTLDGVKGKISNGSNNIYDLPTEASRIEGEALYENGRYNEALPLLTDYVKNNKQPKRSALYRLGMCYYKTKQYPLAAYTLSQSASIDRDEMAQNAWLHAGLSYVQQKNMNQARIAFQQASEMDFNKNAQEEALYNYALTVHENAKSGFGESVNVFERFLNMFPQSAHKNQVSQYLVEVYFNTKDYSTALKSINKIKSPNDEILAAKQKVLYNLGVQEFTASKFKEAQTYMNQSIALGKYDSATLAEAYYWRGEAEYRQKLYAKAASDLGHYVTTTTKKQKNYVLAHYTLGYTDFNQKKYSSAQTYFNKFINMLNEPVENLNSRIATQMKADAQNRLADCYFTSRDYATAMSLYKQAQATDAAQGDYSIYQQAIISGLQGNYDQKVELLNQMSGSFSNSQYGADALYEQGLAYVQTGANEKALNTFNTLINKYPRTQNARKAGNQVAMIYNEMGRTEESITAYRQIIEKFPNTEEARTALANLKDIYTAKGRVNEYAALAEAAGKPVSAADMDKMVNTAALQAMGNEDYQQAYQYYTQLEQQTASEDMRLTALTGRLRSAYYSNDYENTIIIADNMLMNSKVTPNDASEARYYRAESYLHQNKAEQAVNDLQLLKGDTRTVYGAQATVRLAQYAYDTKQYANAETMLLEFIDSGTSHTYWLARAFVLLSDVYKATGRDVEARQYLLSLKSNYTESEEINNMIRERLK